MTKYQQFKKDVSIKKTLYYIILLNFFQISICLRSFINFNRFGNQMPIFEIYKEDENLDPIFSFILKTGMNRAGQEKFKEGGGGGYFGHS